MKTRIKTTTNRHEYHILFLRDLYPPYCDDGYSPGELYSYQKRMYKTWKHNRKTQWKN